MPHAISCRLTSLALLLLFVGTSEYRFSTTDHVATRSVETQANHIGSIKWNYDGESNSLKVAQSSGEGSRAIDSEAARREPMAAGSRWLQRNATITRTFDNLGRILTCTDTSNNTVAYTYDNEGNLATLTYPGNKTVTYTYDGSNRLKTVTDWAARVTTYTYDNAGRLTQTQRPNGTTATYTYDNANRLTGTTDTKGATPLWQSTLGYDAAYRLTTYNATPPTRTYASPPATMTYDNDNRIVSYNSATVTSDADGNMLTAPVNGTLLGTLTWDARNRLTSAGGTTYTYDAENRRISSTKSAQTTIYTWSRGGLDRLLVKTNPDGSITRYVHVHGLIYEETTPATGPATTSFYHYNWQGSTMALTDATGTITARLSYSPYGEVTVVSGTPNTPFLFNGQFGVMTEPNGLYTMQARFYSPIFRRFLSEDPAGFSGGINLFAYTSGDPVNLMDPFGLGPVSLTGQVNRWFDVLGVSAFNRAFYWTLGEVGRGIEMANSSLISVGLDPMALGPVGLMEVGAAEALVSLGALSRSFSNAKALSSIAKTLPEGSFSISNWAGYPSSLPRPTGPFRLLEGVEYNAARNAANQANRALRSADDSLTGWQIHEIHPVKFDGTPIDIGNKMPLPAGAHSEVTNWWNDFQRSIQNKPSGT